MREEAARFRRLPAGAAGGAKIASRQAANPRLTHREATDVRQFLALLRRRLGEPDPRSDSAFSYSIRDTQTGVVFEAYSAQSGPSYGGSPPAHFVDPGANDNRTRPEVMQVLADFERWLESEDVESEGEPESPA